MMDKQERIDRAVIELDGKWEPGVDLPPVGIECEALFMHGASTKWRRAEILRHGVRECAVYVPELGALGWCNTFRPIQSHRDKVIEAACDALGEIQGEIWPDDAAVFLYEKDMLKLPGDEQ